MHAVLFFCWLHCMRVAVGAGTICQMLDIYRCACGGCMHNCADALVWCAGVLQYSAALGWVGGLPLQG